LVDLEKHLKFVENRNVAIKEYGEKVIFLRKIIAGGSDRSFGIHVAQMAGLPIEVIDRAREVLKNLESNILDPNAEVEDSTEQKPKLKKEPKLKTAQLTFFDPVERKLRERLNSVDTNNLTPIEALNLLADLKKILD